MAGHKVICRKQKKFFFAFFVVPLEIARQSDNIDASRLGDSSFENLCPFKILCPIPLRPESEDSDLCPSENCFGQFLLLLRKSMF